MSKHTPGPWAFDNHEFGPFIRCSAGYIISGPVTKRPDGKDNARLIAAAPDLLEALRDLVGMDVAYQRGPMVKKAVEAARAAIAAATGEGEQ